MPKDTPDGGTICETLLAMPKSLVRAKKCDVDVLLNVKWTEEPFRPNPGGRGEPLTWHCKWCACTFQTQAQLRQHSIEAKGCRGGQAG